MQVHEPHGLLGRAPPGPAMPVVEIAQLRAGRGERPARHRLGALGRDGSVLLEEAAGTPSIACLISFA